MDIRSKTKDELILLIDKLNLKIASQEQAIQGKQESRQEAQLRNDNLTRLTALLNALPDLMFVFDSECRFIDYHSENLESLYLNPKKFLGKKPEEVLPQEIGHMVSLKIKAILSSGKPDNFTYDLKIKGDIHHFETRGVLYGNNRVLFIVRDFTEQKQAELLLKQTRHNYESFFNTIDEFLFVLDEKGNIIHVNSTVTDRLGYTLEELTGKPVLMVHPPDRREEASKIISDILNGSALYCPVPVISKSGIQIPVETRVSRGTWDGKAVIFAVTKDISKLMLSEEKFSKLFYINPSACGISELESLKYIEVNEGFTNLLGFTNEEAAGKTPVELGIATKEMIDVVIVEAKKRGNKRNIEADLKAKNGEIKRVLLSAEDISIQGKLYRFTVVYDITERKKAEADLEESREKYRGLSEAAFEAIFLSEKGICIEQNHTAETIFGYSPEEAIGRYGTEWIIPEDRDLVMKNMLAGYEEPYEATALKKDGSTFPCVLKGKMMNYKGKRVRVTSLSDHTARKKAEEELKIKDWAIESSISAIAISDLSGNMKYANPAFLKLWGYSSLKEAIGKSPYSFWQDDKKADETLKSLITEGSWSGEMTAINQQGESFEVQVEASVVKDTQGRPHSMLASFADVTERKKFISSLQEAKEKAEAGNRLKTAFINNISHEIRTPLNGILGFGNLITQPDIGEAEKEQFYSQVRTSSGRLLRTITNYMDISMLASGNLDLRQKPVALYHMLQQLFKKFHPLCTEKNLALNLWNIAENNSVSVWTDEDLLKTILTHILDNAVTFTKHGEITFGFDLRPGEVEFFIRDTGVGISMGMQSLIFESFVQASTSNTSGHDGSGLGLSIALGMAKLLGGGIRVKSEPGHGSEFFVSIPDTGLKKENIVPDASETQVPAIKDPVILIAEDDSTNRLLVKVMLKQSGIKVIEAENGQEAVALCREHPEICLAVMDLKMPVLDGFDATRQIKSFRQHLPVIAVTAYGLSGDEKRAIEAGCSDYLAKPYHKEVLLNKLRRYGII